MDPTSEPVDPGALYKVRRRIFGASLVSHLYLMHGIYTRSVHDTEESNQLCHVTDHAEHFSHASIPHAHVLEIEEPEEWSWQ